MISHCRQHNSNWQQQLLLSQAERYRGCSWDAQQLAADTRMTSRGGWSPGWVYLYFLGGHAPATPMCCVPSSQMKGPLLAMTA